MFEYVLLATVHPAFVDPQPSFRSGPPCQPFSRMGTGEGVTSVKYIVHQKYYETAPTQADVLVLENVPEYHMEEVVKQELGSGWGCYTMTIDPRIFGLGTSRPRVYGLCWKKCSVRVDQAFDLTSIVEGLKALPMMSAGKFFFQKIAPSGLAPCYAAKLKHFLKHFRCNILYSLFFPLIPLRLRTCTTTKCWKKIRRWLTCPSWCATGAEGQRQWMGPYLHLPQILAASGRRPAHIFHNINWALFEHEHVT